MPSLFKRGDRYYVAFHDATRRPKNKQVSLRVSGHRAALLKSEQLMTQYEEGSFDPWSPRPIKDHATLGDAVQRFLKTRQNLSGQSIQKYKSVLGQLIKFLGAHNGLRICSPEAIQDFIDGGNRKPITKKTYSTTLSPFFNWCIDKGWMAANPVARLRLPKVQSGLPKTLSNSEIDRLLSTIRRYDSENKKFSSGKVLWMEEAVRITLALGLRASELCQLKWEDIDIKTKTVRVGGRPGFRTKNSKVRLLPINEALENQLCLMVSASGWVLTTSTSNRVSAHYLSVRFKL